MKKKLYTKILIFSYALEGNPVLESIKKGFLMIVPILFLGAIALVIKSFPVPAFQQFLQKLWGGSAKMFFEGIYEATYGFLSIYLAISISLNYSRKLFTENHFVQGLSVILSVICLTESLGLGREGFSYHVYGNTGTFSAIVIAILAPWIFAKVRQMISRGRRQSLECQEEIDEKSLVEIVLPFMICILIFFVLNIILYQTSGYKSLNELFAAFFGYAFHSSGANLLTGLLFLFISGFLWVLGIHGGNALELVAQNNFASMDANPHVIISKTFLDVFGLMGGCGATLCLLLAVFFVSKKREHREISKIAAPMVLFNVNEIMVFGLPILFNPILMIPFILVPMVSVAIAYGACALGWMPIPTATIEWTTPILLSGYALTGSISGLLVQFVGLIAGVLIYIPFVKLWEYAQQEGEDFLIGQMEQLFKEYLESGEPLDPARQHYGLQRMSNTMVRQLQKAVEIHQIPMYYQPQMDKEGKMAGAEALLRWDYNGRKIFPPLVVQLAKREGIMNELSLEILRKSCGDTKRFVENQKNFKMSVNMVAEQLDDRTFVKKVVEIIQSYQVADNLCLEITEETNMDNLLSISENIKYLKSFGIRLAMDDFSMGHTSLKYLQDSLFDYVKLDGALVREMYENQRSEDIVASIIQLGKKLQFQVIAEYVDTREKEQKLLELGCDYFQGYLYAPAIPAENMLKMQERKL